jgi:hypothetical protein
MPPRAEMIERGPVSCLGSGPGILPEAADVGACYPLALALKVATLAGKAALLGAARQVVGGGRVYRKNVLIARSPLEGFADDQELHQALRGISRAELHRRKMGEGTPHPCE